MDDLASTFKLTVENAFKAKGIKTQLSEAELQQFVSENTAGIKSDPTMQKAAIVEGNLVKFFAKGQLKDGTAVEASETVDVLALAKELNEKLPKAVEEIKEKPVEKPNVGATTTTAKELQKQAEAQKKEAETKLTNTFKAKIAANNGIELNETSLNGLISETLNSYEGKENITVNEKNGTITFTVKGTIPGAIWGTKDGVSSATLNVRDLFTKLNNEATEDRRESERSSFVHTKYVTATESDVTAGLKVARETAKKVIQEEFNKIIVEKYNEGKSANKATSVADISAGRGASIVNTLKLDDVVSQIVKVNLNKVDDFKIKGAKELNGQFSIKTAPENEELKIGAIGYKKTGLFGTSTELIKYGDEISIRSEVENLIKENIEKHRVSYKTVVGQNADKEAEALYKFLTNHKLVENGTVVESVLAAIKDSDKEQFKKDVKHIADQISGSEGNYTLSGKWRNYNVSQEKLKAIKDLAGQLGV